MLPNFVESVYSHMIIILFVCVTSALAKKAFFCIEIRAGDVSRWLQSYAVSVIPDHCHIKSIKIPFKTYMRFYLLMFISPSGPDGRTRAVNRADTTIPPESALRRNQTRNTHRYFYRIFLFIYLEKARPKVGRKRKKYKRIKWK